MLTQEYVTKDSGVSWVSGVQDIGVKFASLRLMKILLLCYNEYLLNFVNVFFIIYNSTQKVLHYKHRKEKLLA